MTNDKVKESFGILQEKLKLVRNTNDLVIKETNNLHIILLNLKIESARIKENNGIKPIADALEQTVLALNNSVKDVVNNHRKTLIESVNNIKEYIESEEKINDNKKSNDTTTKV